MRFLDENDKEYENNGKCVQTSVIFCRWEKHDTITILVQRFTKMLLCQNKSRT